MKRLKYLVLLGILYHFELTAQSFQKKIGSQAFDPLILSNGDIGLASGDSYSLLDSSGNEKWSAFFNSQYRIYSSQESSDRSILLVGSNYDFNSVIASDFILVKKDSMGNTLFSKAYGSNNYECFSPEGSLPFQGGVIFYGPINRLPPNQHIFSIICRIDSTGNLVWAKRFDFGFNYPMRGILTRDTAMVFVGDEKIIKMDSNGNILWSKKSNGPSPERLISIQQNPDGDYSIMLEPKNSGVRIIDIDSAGSFQRGRNYESAFATPYTDFTYLSDSSLLIFGDCITNSSSLCEYAFFHTDKNLNPISATHFGISIHCNTAFKIIADGTGFVATGNEQFDNFGYLIKADNAERIDCADTFQFAVDTASLNLSSNIISDTAIFSQFSFSDSSTIGNIQDENYCGITGQQVIEDRDFQIFPNPFTQEFTLIFDQSSQPSLSIYDIYGKEISIHTLFSGNELHVYFQNEPEGVYFLRIRNGLLQSVIKIIKIH